MSDLIVGGTAGLGLELAKLLKSQGRDVIVTGRHDPEVDGLQYHEFDIIKNESLADAVDEFVAILPKIDLFMYAAGFYQEGTLTELGEHDIEHMLQVGIEAPIWFLRELLQRQGDLAGFIAITSTSQWTPRLKEPIYTAVKAALGQFANSTAEDTRIGKVLVAGPAGMATDFWRMTEHDISHYNDPHWVAQQILEQYDGDYNYKFIKILRDPARVDIAEQR